jgi:hypothetical protein
MTDHRMFCRWFFKHAQSAGDVRLVIAGLPAISKDRQSRIGRGSARILPEADPLQRLRRLNDASIRISMDGRGRWMDNVFIERLWRSLKYECVQRL